MLTISIVTQMVAKSMLFTRFGSPPNIIDNPNTNGTKKSIEISNDNMWTFSLCFVSLFIFSSYVKNMFRIYQSEIYGVWDTIWYDKDSATWNVSNGSTSYSDNTRSIAFNSNSGLVNPSVNNNSFFIPCTDDFIVEFDYSSGNMSLYFAVSGKVYNMGISLNFTKYNNKTLKLLVKPSEDKIDVYIDGVYDNTVTNSRSFGTSETCGLHIRTNNSSGANATFSNLKIYPL